MGQPTPRRDHSNALLGWVLFYTIFAGAIIVVAFYAIRGQYVLAAMILLPLVAAVLEMVPDLRRYWLPESLGGDE